MLCLAVHDSNDIAWGFPFPGHWRCYRTDADFANDMPFGLTVP